MLCVFIVLYVFVLFFVTSVILIFFLFFFFFFKQKTAYEIMPSLVGSEMCIRDRVSTQSTWAILVFYKFLAQKFSYFMKNNKAVLEQLQSGHIMSLSTQNWYKEDLKKSIDSLDKLLSKQMEQLNYTKDEMNKKSEQLVEQQKEKMGSRQNQMLLIRFHINDIMEILTKEFSN
eukprot:TRINITY_DN9589_c0_g1_i8.p2 TRINITY_DN9589_c0_g1~~TRINITY_DN9589_c0_g1_i8.p2  ORF type:complete len:173 (+),score=46.72 TRINITY_DN9589_c0_g1_i8:2-520(+)